MPNLHFTRLYGTNVGSYRKLDLNLEELGTVLVTGQSGSGKSTPWYALTNALYGASPKKERVPASSLVNVHEPQNHLIGVEFQVDGIPYRVEQFRNHERWGNKLRLLEKELDITEKGNRETRKKIVEVIGLDVKNFLSTVFLSQHHLHVIIDGKPAERQEHIMWLFGLTAYQKLGKLAKKKIDQLKDEVSDVKHYEQELLTINDHLRGYPALDVLRKQYKAAAAQKKKLSSEVIILERKKDNLTARVTKLEVRDSLIDELRELGVSGSPSRTDVVRLKNEVERLSEAKAELKAQFSLARNASLLKKELNNYQKGKPVNELRTTLEKICSDKLLKVRVTLPGAKEAKGLRSRLAQLPQDPSDMEDLEAEVATNQISIEKVQRKIKDLVQRLRKGTCPTCKRAWHISNEDKKKLELLLADLRAELDASNKAYYAGNARVKNLMERQELESRLKKLPSEDPSDVNLQIQRLARKEGDLRADIKIAEERERLLAQLKDAPKTPPAEIKKKGEQVSRELKGTQEQYKKYQAAYDLLQRIAKLPDGERKAAKKELSEATDALSESREQLLALERELIETRTTGETVKSLLEKKSELDHKISVSKKAARESKLWADLREGFSYLLRKRERDLLQRLTAKLPIYLHPLFGDQSEWVNAELSKEEDGIEVKIMSGDKELPSSGPSPGQRAKLGLSMLFALRDLYTSRCNLLVLDEPLFQMDAESRLAFMEIVDRVKQQVETLVITTHEQEVKGHTFDQRWETRIDQGISKIITE